jgi:hypothetical protein
MTAHVQDSFVTRPAHRTVRLIWTVLAVLALAATVLIVLLSTGSSEKSQSGPGKAVPTIGQVAPNPCAPNHVIHPC